MSIETLRTSLDEIDLKVNKLLTQRFLICRLIALEKEQKNLPKLDEIEKHKRKQIYSKTLGEYGEAIYETIHEQSLKIQNKT